MHYDIDTGLDHPLCPLVNVAHQIFERITSLLRKHWQFLREIEILLSQLYPSNSLSSRAGIEEPDLQVWTRCVQIADKSTDGYPITACQFQPLSYSLYPANIMESEQHSRGMNTSS